VETGVLSDEGDILLPVEALVKCLGVSVSWDQTTWRIIVTAGDISPLESGDTFYDETDVYWLSRVIYAEAGNQPLLGQIAVGDVVMNRMKDPAFAAQDSVYDVIFAKNQFEVVINGMIYMTPDEQSQVAAKIALEGADVVSGATYFATYELGAGYECVTWIGEHCFMTAA
jgi:N-acetylmuramoyl-L-alanine amidase